MSETDFGAEKRGVPTGPVLDGFGGRAVGVLVLLGRAMPHHRLLGLRMNPLRQPGELKRRDLAFEAERGGELALPLALHRLALLVVVLGLGRELQLVVALGLPRVQRFGNIQHG